MLQCTTSVRFDPDLLDDSNPFELDKRNRPHLFKHEVFGEDDLWDVWISDPVFIPADEDRGDADWLMVSEVPGGTILVVPLAKPDGEFLGDVTRCRPIGLDRAKNRDLIDEYLSKR